MKTTKIIGLCFGILAVSIGQVFSQTNLQFTGITVTDEGNIRLAWSSVSNEVYEIDEADALIDTNTGSTTWNKLCDDYPSQGTNTFWLDTGNYNFAPQILNPKDMPTRFYRIVDLGADSLTDEPTVTIDSDSLTNNSAATGELTFTVTAATDQPGLNGTILYVDGQEMQAADTTTNYTIGSTNYETDTYSINTCEWLNETHILFATTEAASAYSSQINSGPVLTGHGVSPFVSILFSNLVEEISFSKPSFDPSQGATQQVSAVFAANCNWTLDIEDVNSNVVQTASGSGTSMSYHWDGTDNGTNLPNGLYFYYIAAATNGESSEVEIGGAGDGSPPSPDFAISAGNSGTSELWATPSDGSGGVVPLAIYPPGMNTNGLTIFEASPADIAALMPSRSRSASFTSFGGGGGGGFSPDAAGGGGGSSAPTAQNSPPAPQRPPNNPIRGIAGAIGIAADTFTANGTNGFSVGPLDNGLNIGLHISMEGNSASSPMDWPPRPEHKAEVSTFVKTMQHYGWSNPFNEIDSQLNIDQLRGSGTPFNNVDMGVLIGHGTYGTSIDYAANGCKQMYFPITSGGSAQYLRFSEMSLGGPTATNGLKWMVIDACFSLYQSNWNSMRNKGIYPYNSNLHLILGANTETWTSSLKWYNFARYMNYGRHNFYSPYTIRNAYYQGNMDAFQNTDLPSGTTITLSVAGDSACLGDSLQTNTPPSGSWQYDSLEVFSN